MHDMMLPALFLDRPELELRAVYKSISLFCRGGTSSGNPDDKRLTGILIWHGSQVRLCSARTGALILYRSPYVHTRKSTSSTVLSQSDNGVQYVDCNPGCGGCLREGPHRWVYNLFVLHSSDAVQVGHETLLTKRWRPVSRSQPGPNHCRHVELLGFVRRRTVTVRYGLCASVGKTPAPWCF